MAWIDDLERGISKWEMQGDAMRALRNAVSLNGGYKNELEAVRRLVREDKVQVAVVLGDVVFVVDGTLEDVDRYLPDAFMRMADRVLCLGTTYVDAKCRWDTNSDRYMPPAHVAEQVQVRQ